MTTVLSVLDLERRIEDGTLTNLMNYITRLSTAACEKATPRSVTVRACATRVSSRPRPWERS